MRVESVGYQGSIADAIEQATEAEQAGFDTWCTGRKTQRPAQQVRS